jgi:hypothetical protein
MCKLRTPDCSGVPWLARPSLQNLCELSLMPNSVVDQIGLTFTEGPCQKQTYRVTGLVTYC